MVRQLRRSFLGTLITLIVQLLLGTGTNLFVMIPTNHPGARPPEYFSGVFQSVTWAVTQGPVLLLLHASLGLLLVLAGFGALVQAVRSRSRTLVICSAIGAVAILAAGFNGGSYLNYHEDFSSMLMATFFAIAVAAYVVGLYATE